MNNLEYDNIYKFFVSLGIVLMILPIAIAVFLYFAEPILISQTEYESLSDFSLNMIYQRNQLSNVVNIAFPWIAFVAFAAGLLFFIRGLHKWSSQQKVLDEKLKVEAEIQQKTLSQMSSAEVFEKVEKEVKEDIVIETQNNQESTTDDDHTSRIRKYYEIEDLCFSYFASKYRNKYIFKRNIRIGRFEYDFIGVSQKDNIDLIFEIKYYRNISAIKRQLFSLFNRLYTSGINYESTVHRNFRCFAVIVTAKEQLSYLRSTIEDYRKTNYESTNGVEIMCLSEEELNN